MLKRILFTLLALIAIFLAFAAMQPDDFKISRSAKIAAPPEKIFVEVNNQRNWQKWSPWAKLDPNAVMTYEGPEAGVGAIAEWNGNSEMGEGHSVIMESKPNEFIKFKLDFVRPMQATDFSEFKFSPEGNETLVVWNMYGKKSFINKVLCLMMDCDKMIGKDFEEGLANLKSVTETK